MAEHEDIIRKAGEHFRSAADFSFEDAQQRRLRYHLLRLGVVGLTTEDVEDLGELGRLAFQDSDVTEQVAKIKQRSEASPVALAIADIVGQAGSLPGPVSARAVMFGAVLGAYATLGHLHLHPLDESLVATLGAIGGAVALSTSEFIAQNVTQQSWSEYLRMEER